MFNLINSTNAPVNFADFGMAPMPFAVRTESMNSCKNVLIVVADTSDDTLTLLNKRRGYQFYHPEFQAYCLMLSRKEVWSLQAAIDYIVDIQESKKLSQYCQREAVAYTHELVDLYNKVNALCNHRLPDFGSDELVSFLERMLRNSTNVDYRSAGKLMHYEKEHFYKFDKMSDFLNPDDVYTDKDNRIVWTTTKDRLGTHYVDCHLEDLLREALTYRWMQLNYDYTPYIAWDDCDATSSEETIDELVDWEIGTMLDKGIDNLTDEEKIDLATMINMHRDIFDRVCDERGIEFRMR